jgi:hypothetical protein
LQGWSVVIVVTPVGKFKDVRWVDWGYFAWAKIVLIVNNLDARLTVCISSSLGSKIS